MTLDGLTASARFKLVPEDVELSALHAEGGGYFIEGLYRDNDASKLGLFLIQKEFLSLGIEVRNKGASFVPVGASAWYRDRARTFSRSQVVLVPRLLEHHVR